LEEIQKNASSSVQITDHEKQTGDQQHDKLVKVNNKLKRVLQTFKDKIHQIVTERPDLFVNVGEETSERLDHLISTVEHLATQIELLQSEHNESEERLRNKIHELQKYERNSAIPASELLSDVRLGKLNDSNNIDFKSYSFFVAQRSVKMNELYFNNVSIKLN